MNVPALAVAVSLALSTASFGVAQTAVKPLTNLPTATPESVGFSSERLENLHALIQGEIDQKQLAGAITLLARHGKVVDYRIYGNARHGRRRRP